jgi:hypothetical protein
LDDHLSVTLEGGQAQPLTARSLPPYLDGLSSMKMPAPR